MDSRSVPLNLLLPPQEPGLSANVRLFQPKSDTLDVLGAQFASAFEDTDTQLIKRKIQNAFLESDEKINHLELNKMFPDLEVPFNKPTSLELAKSINKQNIKRRQLAKVINNGDPEGLMQRASGLLLGVGAGLMDPVGMALGMGIGRGITTAMGKVLLRSGGTLARVIRPITTGLGGRVFEGAVGNTIQELSIGRPLLKQEQVDITTYDTLTQAIGAGIAFPVLARGSRNIFKFISRGNDATLKATKTYGLAESQFENGKRLNTEPYVNAEMKKELPKMKEDLKNARDSGSIEELRLDLESAVKSGDKGKAKDLKALIATVKELEDLVEMAESVETPDRSFEAKKANDITEDLYYDKEVMDGFNDRADTLIPVDRKIEFEERTAVFEEEFTNFEDQGDLSPAVKKAFDEARVELSQIETLDQIAKEATFCLR